MGILPLFAASGFRGFCDDALLIVVSGSGPSTSNNATCMMHPQTSVVILVLSCINPHCSNLVESPSNVACKEHKGPKPERFGVWGSFRVSGFSGSCKPQTLIPTPKELSARRPVCQRSRPELQTPKPLRFRGLGFRGSEFRV